jgi:DNA-binding NtrC family response regulator
MLTHFAQGFGGSAATDSRPGVGESPEVVNKSPRGRILVVDDEALVRWSVGETLRDRGFDVVEAGDGHTAVRAIVDEPVPTDLVLLDLRLPDSNDLRLLGRIRRLAPSTPVIVMTAFGTPEVTAEARRLGAATVVEKPFDIEQLSGLVCSLLAHSH